MRHRSNFSAKLTRRRPTLRAKFAVLGLVLLVASAGVSAADPATTLQTVPLNWRVGIERLRLPGDETMGLVGASALLGLADNWFVGPAVYGAATGQRGGLFVIGAEALWRTQGPAGSRIEAGLTIGGGGGAAAPVGSGLMFRPHLDWSWPVGPGWLGVSVSRVKFPSGKIASSQLGLVFSVDDGFNYQQIGSAPVASAKRSGLGFDRFWLNVGQYRGSDGNNHGYGGIRADHWLNSSTYVGLEAAGAAQGGADGYAELLASVGNEWSFKEGVSTSSILPHFGVRAALGMAGGGAVDTGGGVLVKLAGTLRWDLPQDLFLGLEAGRTIAPDGSFRANHLHLSLGLNLDRRGPRQHSGQTMDLRSDQIEWTAALSHFPRMQFRDGSLDAVQTIGLRLRRPLSPALDPHLQLAGDIEFAAGGKAGAYGAGLIGVALATPLAQPGLQWGVELLAGAAGGGGVASRGGAVVQPMLRVGWASGAQRWQLGVGQIKSFRQGLSSPVIALTYGAAIGLPRR